MVVKVELSKADVKWLKDVQKRMGFTTRAALLRAIINITRMQIGQATETDPKPSIAQEVEQEMNQFSNIENMFIDTQPYKRKISSDTLWRRIENTTP